MDIPNAGAYAAKEEATSSTETLNCFANTTYPEEAIANSAPVRPDVKTLRGGEYTELKSEIDGLTRGGHSQCPKASLLPPCRPVQPRSDV